MKLRLLVATLAVVLTTGGCTVHFPLADNGPSLQSADESHSTADMSQDPTEPNNRNPIKGNSADTPD